MSDKLEIYRNYGVFTREKVPTYTYGGPEPTAVSSEKITVSVPKGWKVGENIFGETLLTAPFGQNFLVKDVLCGNKYPQFVTCDKNGRNHWYRLKEVKEAGENEKPHKAESVHDREER